MRQLLQNAPILLQNAAGVTKRVDYYKTGQYNFNQINFREINFRVLREFCPFSRKFVSQKI